LQSNNKEVEIIREPGGTEISEIVRSLLLDKKHNHMKMETEIFLFSASRAQLVREKIQPLINKGIYVISDRFHDSTTAYQGYGRGISLEIVKHINKLAIDGALPDITFIIDIPVGVANKRKMEKGVASLDRMELSDNIFFEKVRNGYLTIAKNEKRFRVIDGTKSIENINKNIIEEINLLEKKEVL
jgi:dTMP kinase